MVVVLSQSSCFPAHLRPRAATFGENQTVLQGDDNDDDDDHDHGDHDHDGCDICDSGSVSIVSFSIQNIPKMKKKHEIELKQFDRILNCQLTFNLQVNLLKVDSLCSVYVLSPHELPR